MTLGEKIQKLRKDNNLSQEQLAEALNVSRQALSKWELNTSVPEVDKIILLSNYFKVSTDYLLKDDSAEEARIHQNTGTANRNSAVIISSGIVLVGLIIGWAIGNDGVKLEYLSSLRTSPGLIVQVIGIVCFEVLSSRQSGRPDKASRYLFYGINIWFLAVLPVIFIVGRYFTFVVNSYPGILPIKYMAAVYLMLSCMVSLVCFLCYGTAMKRRSKNN
jgi:transcriptional regulator with XRE-family HTH domain